MMNLMLQVMIVEADTQKVGVERGFQLDVYSTLMIR
jgi:hypothetical protein